MRTGPVMLALLSVLVAAGCVNAESQTSDPNHESAKAVACHAAMFQADVARQRTQPEAVDAAREARAHAEAVEARLAQLDGDWRIAAEVAVDQLNEFADLVGGNSTAEQSDRPAPNPGGDEIAPVEPEWGLIFLGVQCNSERIPPFG